MGYGMTCMDFRKAAVEYAVCNNRSIPKTWEETGYAEEE